MPAIAEKIYARLLKDPDLDIPHGSTREEFARKEADARERQHRNNAEALSLVKGEEVESTLGNVDDKMSADFHKMHKNWDIYNALPPASKDIIDKLANPDPKVHQSPLLFQDDSTKKSRMKLIKHFFEEAKKHLLTPKADGGVGLDNLEATSEMKEALANVFTDYENNILKNDTHMQKILAYDKNNPPKLHDEWKHDLIKTLNPDTKVTKLSQDSKPKSSKPESSELPSDPDIDAALEASEGKLTAAQKDAAKKKELQQNINDAQKAHEDHYGKLTGGKPDNLDTEGFNREDVPYHVQTVGGKSHKLASVYGLVDANGMLNKKGHGLINYAKANGLSATGSFQPKAIQYTKDKKYVLNEKSIQGLVDFYEDSTGKKVVWGDEDGIKDAPIPQGLQTAPSKADLPKSEQEAFEETIMEQAEQDKKAKEQEQATTDDEAGPTETEQLEEGQGDKTQQLINQADDAGLLDYIHEVVEGHGDDNPYHTKEDTINELKEKKDLQKYLGKMHNKHKVDKQKVEEAKDKKVAQEKALEEKQKLQEEKLKTKEMKDEAKALPVLEESDGPDHYAMEIAAHLGKYKDYMNASQKKKLGNTLNSLFDEEKTPFKDAKKGPKTADKDLINSHIEDVGYENLGSDDHYEAIWHHNAHQENINEHHDKLHSDEGASSKKGAFENDDHHAHATFDKDGEYSGSMTSNHDEKGKVKHTIHQKFEGGHDGIHHLNHPLNDKQKENFSQYKEAMANGDNQAASEAKQDLIDSGIPKQAFNSEGGGGDDKYPDPEVAKKKLAEGYVFNEATRHWILKENLEGAQGGMGAHDAEIHSSTSKNEAGQAFALNADGTPHEGNFVVSQAGVHKLGDNPTTGTTQAPKIMGGMTAGQTKANTLGHAIFNSGTAKKHAKGGVTKLKGALHPKGSLGDTFSGATGGILHGTGLEHSKNLGINKPGYKEPKAQKKADIIDATKTIGKYSALGYSPQVAKFMGTVGKRLASKIKSLGGSDTDVKKSLDELHKFLDDESIIYYGDKK